MHGGLGLRGRAAGTSAHPSLAAGICKSPPRPAEPPYPSVVLWLLRFGDGATVASSGGAYSLSAHGMPRALAGNSVSGGACAPTSPWSAAYWPQMRWHSHWNASSLLVQVLMRRQWGWRAGNSRFVAAGRARAAGMSLDPRASGVANCGKSALTRAAR